MKMNELDMLRTQIEREAAEKRKLEDAVMEKLMQQLTMDKATKYTKKSAEKLRKRTEEIVSSSLCAICYCTSMFIHVQYCLTEFSFTCHVKVQIEFHIFSPCSFILYRK